MAGQAEKKLRKSAESGRLRYAAFAIGGWLLYTVISYLKYKSVSYIWSLIFGASSALSYYMIAEALALGVGLDTWQDLFIVTVISELLGSIVSGGEFAFLVVPGYGLFLASKALVAYFQSTLEKSDAPQETKADKTRLAAKKRH